MIADTMYGQRVNIPNRGWGPTPKNSLTERIRHAQTPLDPRDAARKLRKACYTAWDAKMRELGLAPELDCALVLWEGSRDRDAVFHGTDVHDPASVIAIWPRMDQPNPFNWDEWVKGLGNGTLGKAGMVLYENREAHAQTESATLVALAEPLTVGFWINKSDPPVRSERGLTILVRIAQDRREINTLSDIRLAS